MYLQVAGMYGYADDPELVQDHPDGEWPVHHHFQGEPIPDLARIALDDWPRALRPLRPALAKLLTVRGVRRVLFEERSRGG